MEESTLISSEFCEKILQKILGEGFEISNYTIRNFVDGKCGLLGEHLALNLEVQGLQKVFKFFVKTPPLSSVMSEFSSQNHLFEKELFFYQTVMELFTAADIPEISEIAPVFYINAGEKLVFEDLSEKNCRSMDGRQSLSLEATKAALTTFAKFHASTIIFEEKQKVETEKTYRLINQFPTQLKEAFYSNTPSSTGLLNATMKIIPYQVELALASKTGNKEALKDFILETWKSVPDCAQPSTKFRNVICHADPWIMNLMYKFTNNQLTDCKLVDFQMIRYAPPAQDVVSLLYLSTDKIFRQKYLTDCLKFYYLSLTEVLRKYSLENILTEKEFWESAEYYKPFAMIQNLNHCQLVTLPPPFMQKLLDDDEVTRKFIFEDKTEYFLKLCDEDRWYKQKQMDNILEFEEYYAELS